MTYSSLPEISFLKNRKNSAGLGQLYLTYSSTFLGRVWALFRHSLLHRHGLGTKIYFGGSSIYFLPSLTILLLFLRSLSILILTKGLFRAIPELRGYILHYEKLKRSSAIKKTPLSAAVSFSPMLKKKKKKKAAVQAPEEKGGQKL